MSAIKINKNELEDSVNEHRPDYTIEQPYPYNYNGDINET